MSMSMLCILPVTSGRTGRRSFCGAGRESEEHGEEIYGRKQPLLLRSTERHENGKETCFVAYFFEGKILISYIIIFAAFLLIYGIGRRKAELPVYIVTGVIFGIYLYFLIRITQFPVIRTPGMEEALGGNV